MAARIVVTGANGAIGQQLLRSGLTQPLELVAAVRSERAASQLPPLPQDRVRVAQIVYDASETLAAAFAGAQALIHLPGLLIERPDSSYELANVETTRATVEAARASGVGKLVLVSAVGADPSSKNRYFRSKGEAEEIVRRSGVGYTILRAPLVLGPGTEGARATRRHVSRRSAWLLAGGRNLQQPLDVDDLAKAALNAASQAEVARDRTLELAGPECLPDREIIERAASVLGREVRIRSIPVAPVRWLLALRTWIRGPGFSPDAIEVILGDTRVDAKAAAEELGISLTPLDLTIRRSLELPDQA
jgi:NADH dehydrogenase